MILSLVPESVQVFSEPTIGSAGMKSRGHGCWFIVLFLPLSSRSKTRVLHSLQKKVFLTMTTVKIVQLYLLNSSKKCYENHVV